MKTAKYQVPSTKYPYHPPKKQKAALTQNFLPDLAPTPSPTADIFFRRLQKSSLDAREIRCTTAQVKSVALVVNVVGIESSCIIHHTLKISTPRHDFRVARDSNRDPISVLKDNGVLYLNEPAYAINMK
ncbi:Adenylate kinase 9 [Bienertia sinuspersici]